MGDTVTAALRVGVVGAGAMGADHVRTLTTAVPGTAVTRVYDRDTARAEQLAQPAGGEVAASAEELIGSDEVDAVIIASPDMTHADLAVACISAGKPVLCEKPLAVTAQDALRVVEAEVAGGRRLVQVGFMRRYDPGYARLKETVTSGVLGDVRVVHNVHRNASSATSATGPGIITGSMIHELDTVAWLLDDEIVGIRVESPVRDGLPDPQLATLEMAGGALATVEVFVNAGYGYDVRCEVVGTTGTASLVPTPAVSTRIAGVEGVEVARDFVVHFADAYRHELAAWARAACAGGVDGPTAWDGYLANVVAEAGVAALLGGSRQAVVSATRPDLYARGER
ncbi:Gfo/Idh/MocA family protein [Mumia sp. ZJ1417]|uniref:Gfo/Idh/MocA family protein n=1 Tax=Mumia sp. ZJ1417 TaxID=2708082 RepID=UPI001FB8B3D2|nr:Gfo/Idh/MocA family oxidoreductase [Mumia sp. ZJ1417]